MKQIVVLLGIMMFLFSCTMKQDESGGSGISLFPDSSNKLTIIVNNTSDETVTVYVDGRRMTSISPRKLGRFSVKKDVDSHTIRVRGEGRSSGSTIFRRKGEEPREKVVWDGDQELEWFDSDKMPLREIEISSGGGISTKYQSRRY